MKDFRVWSDYWKKYATEAELYMGGSVDAIFESADGVTHHENTDLVVEFKTGLKDKNGKEIYEGDIVENTYENVGKVRYEVKWDCGRFIMTSKNPYNLVQIGMGIYPNSSKVIGNIHDNQEALGEPKSTYREEFNRITDGCSARFCFALLAHAMGLSEYHASDIVKNVKDEHYQKAIRLYKAMIGYDGKNE